MKIEYDAVHDLLNIEFLANVPIDDSLEADAVVIDYAKDKRIVAIEVLDASKRTTRKPLDLVGLAIVRSSFAAYTVACLAGVSPATGIGYMPV